MIDGDNYHHALDVEVLKKIALMGGLRGFIKLSSGQMGQMLGVTQQAASRRLIDMEKKGLIERKKTAGGQMIHITPPGKKRLLEEYYLYQRIFENVTSVEIKGRVASGSGEGSYYLSIPEYAEQFKKVAGFRPYPGTLNIKVVDEDVLKLSLLRGKEGGAVRGFVKDGKTYGDVKVFPAKIIDEKHRVMECACVVPLKTHHEDVVEIISDSHIRRTMGLADGDVVRVEVLLSPPKNQRSQKQNEHGGGEIGL